MKKNKLIIIVITVVLVVIGMSYFYQKNKEQYSSNQEVETSMMIDVPFIDVSGQEVMLSDFTGKPIFLNFWSTTCYYCMKSLDFYQEFYDDNMDMYNLIMLVSVNSEKESIESVVKMIEEKGYTFPVYFDTTYQASITYNVTALPTLWLINDIGEIIARGVGEMNASKMQQAVDLLIN